jgi:hypothetical protein
MLQAVSSLAALSACLRGLADEAELSTSLQKVSTALQYEKPNTSNPADEQSMTSSASSSCSCGVLFSATAAANFAVCGRALLSKYNVLNSGDESVLDISYCTCVS